MTPLKTLFYFFDLYIPDISYQPLILDNWYHSLGGLLLDGFIRLGEARGKNLGRL